MNENLEDNTQEKQFVLNQALLQKNTFNNNFDIIIKIQQRQSRGFGLKKHTTYHIKGVDKHGQFDVWRRFNQFNQLRICLVKAWPGCLIPSLPSKNPLTKNQEQINRKRQRYLDYFLKKMAQRSYLVHQIHLAQFKRYLCKMAVSNALGNNKPIQIDFFNTVWGYYRIIQKSISSQNMTEIFDFASYLENNIGILQEYRRMAKELAISKDIYNSIYKNFFKIIKQYEESMMSEYVNTYIYEQEEVQQVDQSIELVNSYNKNNSYWMLYDMVKNQERDAKAFVALLKSIEHYGDMAKNYEGKIKNNIDLILDTSEQKFNFKSLTMKGTPQQKKYQLQIDNQALKAQRQKAVLLRDIITALVYYIEIKDYKEAKIHFYNNIIYKFSLFQCASAQNMKQIWLKLKTGIQCAYQSLLQ